MPDYDIAVAGGGIVGLTAALAMARQGFTVIVIEAVDFNSTNKGLDRVYAINEASQLLFRELGVWQHLEANDLSPYRRMHIWDEYNRAAINFDISMIGKRELGSIITEKELQRALKQELELYPHVSLTANTKINDLQEVNGQIQLAAQEKIWLVRLLIVADGRNSTCRRLLKVPITEWPYHQQAIVATVETEKEHDYTAFQVFTKDGALAFLPLQDQKRCSIVWSTERGADLLQLTVEQFNYSLAHTLDFKLGKVKICSERHSFALAMNQAKQYSGANWVLMGDAAHTIHPLAGLGLNLGLADVRVWLDCLQSNDNNLLAKRAFGAYQRQRKSEVWQVIFLMEMLKLVFITPFPPIRLLRGLGLQIIDKLVLIKRMLIKYAAGVL